MSSRNRNAVLDGIICLRRAAPAINLNAAIVFFYVAENPGINTTELAEVANLDLSTASRIVRSLAIPDVAGSLPPYYGLIEIFDDEKDQRGRVLHLSKTGLSLCGKIEDIIARATPIAAADPAGAGLSLI